MSAFALSLRIVEVVNRKFGNLCVKLREAGVVWRVSGDNEDQIAGRGATGRCSYWKPWRIAVVFDGLFSLSG
jgi:hypothetical protein